MKNTPVLFLLVFQLFSHNVQPYTYHNSVPATSSTSCVTADQVGGGRCVPVHQCQRISFMLANWNETFPRHVQDYLQRSQCVPDGGEKRVCCALGNIRSGGSQVQTDWNARRWHPHHIGNTNPYGPMDITPNIRNTYSNAPNAYQSSFNSNSQHPNRQSFYPHSYTHTQNDNPHSQHSYIHTQNPHTQNYFADAQIVYTNSGNMYPHNIYPNTQNVYPNTPKGYPQTANSPTNTQNVYSNTPNGYPYTPHSSTSTHNAYSNTPNGYPHPPISYSNSPNFFPNAQIVNPFHIAQSNELFHGLSYGENLLNSMQCGAYSRDRISNGETVKIFEFPWMALLEYERTQSRKRFQCAGSLITDRYVLTAAHCTTGAHQLISVRLGEHNLNTEVDCELSFNSYNECAPPYEDIGVEQILTHPQYTAGSLMHDIALLRLNRVVQFKRHIQPICLPRSINNLHMIPNGLTISGWGETKKGFASKVLMKASISLHSTELCNRVFSRKIQLTAEQICAGGDMGRSTCHGDSGGPLFAAVSMHGTSQYVQFGISSAGAKVCGSQQNIPAVYTRLTSYLPWIIGNIQP